MSRAYCFKKVIIVFFIGMRMILICILVCAAIMVSIVIDIVIVIVIVVVNVIVVVVVVVIAIVVIVVVLEDSRIGLSVKLKCIRYVLCTYGCTCAQSTVSNINISL